MPPITTREQLFRKIHTHRRRLSNNLKRLTPEQLEQPGAVPNGWSGKDILAHLADWQQRFLRWLDEARRGGTPITPAPGLTWKPKDVDQLNRQIYETYREQNLQMVLELFNHSHLEFISTCESLSEEELFTPGYYSFTGQGRLCDWLVGFANHDAWGQRFILKRLREKPLTKVKNRDEIISRLAADRRRLEKTICALTPAEMTARGVIGEWSIKDILAHLAEWESFLIPWVAASRRGEPVETPAPGLTWKQVDVLNERIYQTHKDQSGEEILIFFRSTHDKFMETVESLTEKEIVTRGYFAFTGKGSLYNWLAAFAAHDRWGKTKIRTWLKTRLYS
jgi:hypothetical protein